MFSKPKGDAYHSGPFFRPFLGLAYAPIVETDFPDLALSFLDFSPWTPLSTFSIFAFEKSFWILNKKNMYMSPIY